VVVSEALVPAEGWIPVPCDSCGDHVRVDGAIDQMDPRPKVYCAACFPFPLLPGDMAPEDFA